MKKVLLTTSALAFAGSAFAADVSGYVISAYKNVKDSTTASEIGKSQFTETEVYFSGSKTASNGLTFGATYTLGFEGQAKTTADSHTKTTQAQIIADLAVFDGTSFAERDGTVLHVSNLPGSGSNVGRGTPIVTNGGEITAGTFTEGQKAYHEVSSFVSGSFGKVTMGKQAYASKSHGASSLAVGNGIDSNITAVAGRKDTTKGLSYETPVFNGLSAAYTMEFGKKGAKSYAIHYSGQFAGVGVKAAYGSFKEGLGANTLDLTDIARDSSWGIQLSKGAFAVSYSRGKDKTTDISIHDKKQIRWGVAYTAGKVSLGYSRKTTTIDAAKTRNSVITASYAAASGLDVFVEQQKEGDKKTQLVGTNISF